ncbi:MAG: hypothetical protein ACI9CF_001651 [Candidatus Omnitrophota bacterium]|jgi:hypothetical protein
MFTKDDFYEHIDDTIGILRQSIVIYTDLINDLNDVSIKVKLRTLTAESVEFYRHLEDLAEGQ